MTSALLAVVVMAVLVRLMYWLVGAIRARKPGEGMTFRSECPGVDEMIARKDEMGVNADEAQYIYWLRVGVSEYLKSHSEAELRNNWPTVKSEILESHGY